MTELWDRDYMVTVDTIEITKLDVAFSVTKTLKKEPNTCDLTIYNLNPDHRSQLAQVKTPWVKIEAGYKGDGTGSGNKALIFHGQLRGVHSYREGPDWITELHSGDGEKALKNARINKSYSKGTRVGTIIDDLVEAMGIGKGNSQVKSWLAKWTSGGSEILNGLVLSGSCREELTGILKSMGMEWSVQDGELQILDTGKPLEGVAVVLSPSTGLVGSPTLGSEGIISITSLMNGAIVPGSTISLDSSEMPKGFYRAERCDYVGETAGQDWYVNIEAKAL